MTVEGYQIHGSATGSTALLQPVAMCGVHRSWMADCCAAVLVRYAIITSVDALTSWADWSEYEIFMADVKKILTEGRPLEATTRCVAGEAQHTDGFDVVAEKETFV